MRESITIGSAADYVKLKSRADWKGFRDMTEEEIVAGANSDPDNPLRTDEDLKGFKRVIPLKQTTLLNRLKIFIRVPLHKIFF